MNDGDGEDGWPEIAGLPAEEAVDVVLDADDSLDRGRVRSALGQITRGGRVRADALEDTLGETAKFVSTPETRTELAAMALDDVRERASPVADLGAVRSRLEGYDARLSSIQERLATLNEALQRLVEGVVQDGSLAARALENRRIRAEANDLQGTADELTVDLEDFEEWLAEPSVRAEALAADVDALESRLSAIEATVDAVSGETGGVEAGTEDDPATSWAAAAIEYRVAGLLLADLRSERDDLGTWIERTDEEDEDGLGDVDARLADLERRRDALGDRLDALARPAWRDRFGNRLSAVDDVLESFEPPVKWGAVEAALDEYRE